eukprot:COSAG02_NODE_1551_length_11961_cov_19.841173_10_plen_94_part_00
MVQQLSGRYEHDCLSVLLLLLLLLLHRLGMPQAVASLSNRSDMGACWVVERGGHADPGASQACASRHTRATRTYCPPAGGVVDPVRKLDACSL